VPLEPSPAVPPQPTARSKTPTISIAVTVNTYPGNLIRRPPR
jgi:hypothetical protein